MANAWSLNQAHLEHNDGICIRSSIQEHMHQVRQQVDDILVGGYIVKIQLRDSGFVLQNCALNDECYDLSVLKFALSLASKNIK